VLIEGAVGELHLEVTHALEHRVHLGQRTFSGLHHRDAVLRIALRLSQTTDLATHLLGDPEAGGVIGRAVDAIAAGELLHRLRGLGRRRVELTVGVERLDVVLDTKAHDSTLLVDRGWANTATPCRLHAERSAPGDRSLVMVSIVSATAPRRVSPSAARG